MKSEINILIIEDNITDQKMMQKFFKGAEKNNYNTRIYDTLEEGLDFLTANEVDLVFLDLFLPDSDFRSTLNELESISQKVPVIVLTGMEEEQLGLDALKAGAQDYLQKDLMEPRLLWRSIKYAMGRHKIQRELNATANQLKVSERKLLEAQEIASIGNWEFDPFKNEMTWSEQIFKIFDTNEKATEPSYSFILDRLEHSDRELVKEVFLNAIEKQANFNADVNIRSLKNRTKHVNLQVRGIRSKDNIIMGTIQDISQRKELEEKYHRLFDESRDAIYISTEDGKFIDYNKATLSMFGYSREEMDRIDVRSLYYDQGQRDLFRSNIKKHGFVRDFEFQLKRKDGTLIESLVTANSWRSNDGLTLGYQGIIRDVTERGRTQELIRGKQVAEQSAKVKQQFLANMSHEIRTPINVISGMANLLMQTEPSPKQKEYISGITNSSDHLLVLISDVLDFSKIEAGKIEFATVEFNLKELVSTLVQTFTYKAAEKGVDIAINVPDVLDVTVLGDSLRLNQILLNLISNALKFTPKGSITIGIQLLTETSKDYTVAFAVSDTGIGISEDKIGEIFGSFNQAANFEHKIKEEGTGLGLTITKNLLEMQGGSIAVKSKLDEGSTFSFVLKFKKPQYDSSGANTVPVVLDVNNILDIGEKQILIVEDKKLNQVVLRETLANWWGNAHFDIAENGKIAIEKVKEKDYDLVLMDIQMPEMDGYEATNYIRNEFQAPKNQVPIVAFTAYATTEEAQKCLSSGMDDFIPKPFKLNVLYSKVLKALGLEASASTTYGTEETAMAPPSDDLDLSYLESLTNENPELKKQIVHLLIQETPEEVRLMKGHLETGNWNSLRAVAHKLKGSMALMGLKPLEDDLKTIQDYAKEEINLEQLPGLIKPVAEEVLAAIEQIKVLFPEWV